MEKFEIQLWEAPQLVIESWTETEDLFGYFVGPPPISG